ncbi:MAG: trigger factor [Acidimicrobiales bacterium]
MKSTVETLEGNKVKLLIEVDATEIDSQVDAAFKRLAQQVKLPGFRPGKAPRKVLEARMGTGIARQDALRESLPEYYAEAIKEHEVDVIAAPELEITSGAEGGPVAFEAVVQTRPTITISGYESLQVTIPSPNADEAEVDARVERLQVQNAEYETVERAAQDEDQVLIDIQGYQNDEAVEGLTATEYLYDVGSGGVVPEIDENLRGASAGDTVEFDAPHPEEGEDPLHFSIEVHEVKARVLPEVTDEWVAGVTEYADVEAMRDAYRSQLQRSKLVGANMAFQQQAAEALAALVSDDVPDPMVQSELNARLNSLDQRMRSQGMDLNRYLQVTGQSPEDLVAEHRSAAEHAVKIDLALRAIATQEAVELTDEDLDNHFGELSRRFGGEPDELRATLTEAGHMAQIKADIKKTKALTWVLERVAIVDEDGNPVERSSLELPNSEQVDGAAPNDAIEDTDATEDTDASPDAAAPAGSVQPEQDDTP